MKIFARPREAQGRWFLWSPPAGSRFSAANGHCGESLLRNAASAQSFGDTGGELRNNALRQSAHDSGYRRLAMKLAHPAQTSARFLMPTQIAAQAELEAKRRHAAVFAQHRFGPRQPRLVTTRRQLRARQCLAEGKYGRIERA